MKVELIDSMGTDLTVVNAARVRNLRISDDAQEETREIAQKISTLIGPKFPISWKYLNEEINKKK